MKNQDVFFKDPATFTLLNEGVVRVADGMDDEEVRKLKYELETFVCEGQYATGLERILENFLSNLKNPNQKAVWVSGFYGSGKSHLVKILRYLWTDFEFTDKSTARGTATLNTTIKDALVQLSSEGKKGGGLHAASGTLGAGAGPSVRLALLGVVNRSAGLPEDYAKAGFIMWLKREGIYADIVGALKTAGKDLDKEINYLYVSDPLAQALLKAKPKFATDAKEVKSLIKAQFPQRTDITDVEMHQAINDALAKNGKMPCTLIVLDEVQQYIGENADRGYAVQEVTESCSNHFGGKLLFVATGQSALAAGVPNLKKLMARFPVSIQLADSDVETVTRQVILKKKSTHEKHVNDLLEKCAGEISRQLKETRIGPKPEDSEFITADYPLLPVRRRFWEAVLRTIDTAGTEAQLRSQLRLVYEAVRQTASLPLGNVVSADFIFDQNATAMVQNGILPKEINEIIVKLNDGTADGKLSSQLCALIFLIGTLPHDGPGDPQIRANEEILADLLVTDITIGSSGIRNKIPALLKKLVDSAKVMRIGDEYRMQTKEGSLWEHDFKNRRNKIVNDESRIAAERGDLLRKHCSEMLGSIKKQQGKTKVARKIEFNFAASAPQITGTLIPVWVRNEWDTDSKSIQTDIQKASDTSPLITVVVPRKSAEALKSYIADLKAAEDTLNARGIPSTPEGTQARQAMETRRAHCNTELNVALRDILDSVRIYMAGGSEVVAMNPVAALEDAVDKALVRQFPQFDAGDDEKWPTVLKHAKEGSGSALEVLGYKGDVNKHPVCKLILDSIGAGKKGGELRKTFAASPYGWSQDSVDAAIMIMLVSGNIMALQENRAVSAKQLDQTKIGVTEFRRLLPSMTASQKIEIRKLFTSVNVDAKPGEEHISASKFIDELQRRRQLVGGEPPLPVRPERAYLEEIGLQSGNDQLALIYDKRVELKADIESWKKSSDLVAKRLPRWETLLRLADHVQALERGAEIGEQVEAIRRGRTLLNDPDPVPDLCAKATTLLRSALNAACKSFTDERETQMTSLQANADWKATEPELQQTFLKNHTLGSVPACNVGTEGDVLATLAETPLATWKDLRDALPARFKQAAMDAARLHEPKSVAYHPPSATLKTEADVDKYVIKLKAEIMTKLNDKDTGAVVI